MPSSPFVVDVTHDEFRAIVEEQSHRVPVLVDFWAAWCAPCRTLMPILEKFADQLDGKLLVARVNADEQRELAAAFGVRGLPTVKLFRNGQVVDEFVGLQPEGVNRSFLEPHLPHPADELLELARSARSHGDSEAALVHLRRALEVEPSNERIHPRLAEALIDTGALLEAEEVLGALPANRQQDADVRALAARLSFAQAAEGTPAESELERRVAADPADLEARYRLSAVLVGRGAYEAAMEQLLEIMRRDRTYRDDAGRKGLLALFELLGGRGPLVTRYRSRMSAALY